MPVTGASHKHWGATRAGFEVASADLPTSAEWVYYAAGLGLTEEEMYDQFDEYVVDEVLCRSAPKVVSQSKVGERFDVFEWLGRVMTYKNGLSATFDATHAEVQGKEADSSDDEALPSSGGQRIPLPELGGADFYTKVNLKLLKVDHIGRS